MGLNKLGLAALVAMLVAAGMGWWFYAEYGKNASVLSQVADMAGVPGLDVKGDVELGKDDVDIAVQTVELSQGEAGQQLWSLKARSASYSQDQGKVAVDEPEIVYYFKDSGKTLSVRAAQGLVEQEERRARLWPDVWATMDGRVITAGELRYDGETSALTLHDDVRLTGEGLAFRAEQLRVDLATGDMAGEGGVTATFRSVNGLPGLQGAGGKPAS